ncbi:membrane protein [Nocardiopsis terrae]|uniref:DUF58 domain-containing protein n=1 Tax=Nocardiopsis terrae TaxID=372655 RepID=A0ABR9HJK0_9ACTN|nr:DUF58 domain-containing protein [Nocardiopsis terrae]MBE1459183.1 hypothetical protein [Nocardiopsis terrae]GHC88614.1 membrane protein [Nocardiopsis terrae]
MRPHRTLTARGGLMLFFGVVALVCGFVIGQRELVGVGLFLALVPPVSALTVLGAAGRVVHSRALRPQRVPAGTDTRVLVRIGNSSPSWPVSWVRIEDTLPVRLGYEPRYTVGHLPPRAVRDVTYLVRPAVRGRYPVGPLRVSVLDPLGCVRVTRVVGAPTPLLVTPPVVALAPLSASDGSLGENTPRRSVTGVGEQDPIPREYRHGDELRRVHWRSTAKHGELMVRRDEQHWREHSTLLLDTRYGAHSGEGPWSSLETAVSVAASVAVNLLDTGHELRLHTERGRLHTENTSGVLDVLATAESSETVGLQGGVSALEGARGVSARLVVAVLGALSAEDALALSRANGSGLHVAVLCTRAAWASDEDIRRTSELLAANGWRVVPVSDPTELPPLWHRAISPTGGGRPAPAGARAPWEGSR